MKHACLLLFTLFVLSSVAQPFQADTFGRVKDPAFLQFIKSRNYELVEDFTPVHPDLQMKVAYVWKSRQRLCIDLNGKEFSSKDEAEDFHLRDLRQKFLDAQSGYGESFYGEEELKKDPLRSRFTDIMYAENNLAIVKENGFYGIYNLQGIEVVPLDFYSIEYNDEFDYFTCRRKVSKRYVIYDRNGKLKSSDLGFFDCEHFNRTLFIIKDKKDGDFGLWNFENNDTVLPLIYEKIDWLLELEDYAEITINPNEKSADDNNNEVIDEEEYEESLRLDDLIMHGMIDTTGKIILEAKYQQIQYAKSSGFFVVKLNDKFGVISPQNKQLVPYEYDKLNSLDKSYFSSASCLPKNLLVFQKPNGKTGVMNVNQKTILEPVYDGLIVTYIGLIAFKDELTGLISPEGETIIPFQKMEVNEVGHGKMIAFVNGKRCTFDFYGNVMYR